MSKKVAAILTDLFEDSEFFSPKEELENAGFEVESIGFEPQETIKSKNGVEYKIGKGISDADPSDYDALLIAGGYSPDKLRKDERFLTFTQAFSDKKKPIFVICHGPQVLINAKVIKGKKVTSAPQVAVDLENAGAQFEDKEVVYDESGLISSRGPDDLPAFNKAIIQALKDV